MGLQEADPEEFRRQLKIAVVQTNVRVREYEEGKGYKTYNNEHEDELKDEIGELPDQLNSEREILRDRLRILEGYKKI